MLADWAESINGKLYVGGGGFDRIYAVSYEQPISFSFGALLTVPWNKANEQIHLRVWVETADGQEAGWEIRGNIVAGRAPNLRRGQDTTAAVAARVAVPLDAPADLVMKITFGEHERALPFFVETIQPTLGFIPPGGASPSR